MNSTNVQIPLLCPKCYSTTLQELTRVITVQDVTVIKQGDTVHRDHPVSSEVNWDGGEFLEVQCRNCGWKHDDPDYVSQLVPGCTQCESALSDSDTDGYCVECREE